MMNENEYVKVSFNRKEYDLVFKAIYLARGAADIAGNDALSDKYRAIINKLANEEIKDDRA